MENIHFDVDGIQGVGEDGIIATTDWSRQQFQPPGMFSFKFITQYLLLSFFVRSRAIDISLKSILVIRASKSLHQ